MIKNCAECKKEINVKPCRVKKYNFCSQNHYLVFGYRNKIIDSKKQTSKANNSVRLNGQPKNRNKPASWIIGKNRQYICKKISEAKLKSNWMKGRYGELNPCWTGGHTLYRGKNWNKIKQEAKKRDGNQCVNCGITERLNFEYYGQPLQVDHIIPYKISRNSNLNNLQTLCCSCHGKKWAKDLRLVKTNKL